METFELAGLRGGKWMSLNFGKIEAILSPYSDKKIAVLNMAGDSGTGKSFALSFFLRFLKWQQLGQSGDWLAQNEDFKWTHQSTKLLDKGINVWPEVFGIGNDRVLLLMDTQGLDDSESENQSNQMLFIFSTLMASVQILNLQELLTVKTIKSLNFFVSNFVEEGAVKFFPNLLLLIRDWKHPDVHRHGSNGGQYYLNRSYEDIANMWNPVRVIFQEVGAFLMPPPGDEEAVDSLNNQSEINAIQPEFLTKMRAFVEGLLGQYGSIRPKQQKNGEPMTCKLWLEQMKFFAGIFQNQAKLPPVNFLMQDKPKPMLQNGPEDTAARQTSELKSVLAKMQEYLNEVLDKLAENDPATARLIQQLKLQQREQLHKQETEE